MLALAAMLLQLLFAAEHASAMAAAAARGGSDGTPLGFLEICTAQGLITIPAPPGTAPSDPAQNSSGGKSCSVCGTAAATGAASTPTAIAVQISVTLLLHPVVLIPTQVHISPAGCNPHRITRAPPVFLL
jgi:hypothetical protein